MEVIGVIPARFSSTRFPGKPLALIAGKPMIQHVVERCQAASLLSRIIVATDDQRIHDCVESFGAVVEMTSVDHASGTDRLGEVAKCNVADYYVNIQGDEPLIDASAIDALVKHTLARNSLMSTLVTALDPTEDAAEIASTNVVKAVVSKNGCALYFSRAAVPYPRCAEHVRYHKHIGIYMYSRETLAALCNFAPTPLEQAESLEQLRALEHGIDILAVTTRYNPIGVDTPEDIARVEAMLKV